MHIPRIYIDTALIINETFSLPKEAAHHIGKVLRREPNDPLILFNGHGGEYHGHIVEVAKNNVSVLLTDYQKKESSSSLSLHLGQALTRNEKMDFIVQKATELGVTAITPIITEFVNIHLDTKRVESRLEHRKKIIINAAQQCGRTCLPEIHSPIHLKNWLVLSKEEQGFILSPASDFSLHKIKIINTKVKLLIGPEGGLSLNEEQLAEQAGFSPIRLGPRILRTETASLAAITALQVYAGDMG